MAEIFFSKIPCFQHILLNNFRRTYLNHENCSLRRIFGLEKPHYEKFWSNLIKNESCKCYLGNKEQRAMFLVVSRLNLHFGFGHPFFACPIGRASKTARPKSRAPREKFVHPWYKMSLKKYLLHNVFSLITGNTKP